MELVDFALTVIDKAGTFGVMVLVLWLLLSGRLVTRGEMDRAVQRAERNEARADSEAKEWKFMAMRGTDLAQFLGEKAATKP